MWKCHVMFWPKSKSEFWDLGLTINTFSLKNCFPDLDCLAVSAQNMSFRVHWPLLAHSREEKVYGLPLYHARIA